MLYEDYTYLMSSIWDERNTCKNRLMQIQITHTVKLMSHSTIQMNNEHKSQNPFFIHQRKSWNLYKPLHSCILINFLSMSHTENFVIEFPSLCSWDIVKLITKCSTHWKVSLSQYSLTFCWSISIQLPAQSASSRRPSSSSWLFFSFLRTKWKIKI